ncbi:ABC transporter ATP-binding protein [Paenibacillus lactis]|uniref:Energy-coupling factor transport system ATP-binding protein n=1 Tax=Paenibacillus lactis TaxID=228574 RepID=A0ABS4F8G5_9BACL|nr:ABC transporter ATP-binding protein [Paenibacillus lactis]MBP1892543.1 energy-coupling factor transport system ATP-binding protein [Paenibacillus lactis]HAF97101.1 ABC transporter [Paenibacillus lactis]
MSKMQRGVHFVNTVDAPNDPQGEPALYVEGLRLKYPGEERLMFKDLSFSAARGEKVLLLGPSGCGKSTLLQVLSGMIPRATEVPMKCEAQKYPASWGYVFQDPDTQFCMPFVDEELAFVLENQCIPREQMEERMQAALQAVGLELESLHVKIAHLSQGMKQRLALASALLLEPEVLFLDEPSALLDPEGREQIWTAVKAVSAGRTLIIVEHRIEEMAEYADRVVLFSPDGTILGEGTPADVFARYSRELKEFGIWYPGVWDDYAVSPSGMEVFAPLGTSSGGSRQDDSFARDLGKAARLQNREGLHPVEESGRLTGTDFTSAEQSKPAVQLAEFSGKRWDKAVITVQGAEVYPGDFIAIVGPNGAGKSSLLLSLMGLLNAEGMYLLGGEEVPLGKGRRNRKQRERMLRRIGFVFQNPELQFVTERVTDEVAYSLLVDGMSAGEAAEQARRTLERFGLDGKESRHPYQLSTGQKRRLSVATAMARQPAVLLLDEPTFGQDARNTFAILEMCERLRQAGTAIVMVTHEMRIAEQAATHIWEIRQGQLVSRMASPRLAARRAPGFQENGYPPMRAEDEAKEFGAREDNKESSGRPYAEVRS